MRCQHCNKLTHSEHLNVYYDVKDSEKIEELYRLKEWTSAYMYSFGEVNPNELGKLKCGDMVLHFIATTQTNEEIAEEG